MNTKRQHRLTFRATEEELTEIKKREKDSGAKNSQAYLLRAALQNGITKDEAESLVPVLEQIFDELKRVGTELKREGNNLNQIAAKLNGGGAADGVQQAIEENRATLKELSSVWQSLRQFQAAHL